MTNPAITVHFRNYSQMSAETNYKVIIASAGDIVIEGKIVSEVCSGINAGLLPNHKGISFQIKKWEDVFTSVLNPQEIIKKLQEECDILVCIFHKRFGTSADPGQPCDLEAFLSAYDLWKSQKKPQFLFFFKEVKVSTLRDIRDPQLIKVLELKELIKDDNALNIQDFKSPSDFCEAVQDQLDGITCENAGPQ